MCCVICLDINTGDNFECTLGDGTSTKVTYARSSITVKVERGAPFPSFFNTTTDTTKDDGLLVGWEKLVDGKGGEKEGKFEWKWKVGSGAKVNHEAEWEIKVPGEVRWVEGLEAH